MTLEALYQVYKAHPVITTDSRNCIPDSIFFALKGENFNGNCFATQALKAGCAYAVTDEPGHDGNERIIKVDNCLETLQQLARYHRRKLTIPVIGITGTNGKTTTKELTAAVLQKKYNVCCTQGNLNNHIGVPLTLLSITPEHDIAVIEMGANHPGEIKFLSEIAEPDFGLITNVGKAHLEGFGSFAGVIKTKTELYDFLRTRPNSQLFICHENEFLQPLSYGLQKIEYGTSDKLFITGQITGCSPYLAFEFKLNGLTTPVQTQLVGAYNLPNALAATAIGAYFNISSTEIQEALEAYEPRNKRSQLTQTERNTLIIDAYNANPTSMSAAIDNFKQMTVDAKVLILGDMRELGADSLKEHAHIVALLNEAAFNTVLLVGDQFCEVAGSFTCFKTTAALNEYLASHPFTGQYILIKGSRGIQLEKCMPYL